jgi:hypothetical protein
MPLEPISEQRECADCLQTFAVYEGDLPFYRRFDVPVPDLCFDCRLRRRLASHNRRSLYRRRCDATGADIVSWLSPDKPFKAYKREYWYGDQWDARSFGRDFDFSRPFFEQFYRLMLDTPMNGAAVAGEMINSDYTNDSAYAKNCYLSFDFGRAEDALYSETFDTVKDAFDCLSMLRCELLYECVACLDCYNLKFSRFCRSCSDSWFLRDCVGCRRCFGCTNLRQKEYHLFNRHAGRAEFERFMAEFNSGDRTALERVQDKVENLFATEPARPLRGVRNQGSSGDWLNNCKNAFYCFNSTGLEDCRYCSDMLCGAKDSMDVHVWGMDTELSYNSMVIGEGAHNVFCSFFTGFAVSDCAYCIFCTRNCRDLFGCIGLLHADHCILNKPYSPEEYSRLRARIVAHMKETGEWGKYFPPQYAYFGYNETLAAIHYPMPREEVLSRGWKWSDYEAPLGAAQLIKPGSIPACIEGVDDSILQHALVCEVTGRPFKLISKELAYYRKHRLPLPRRHPDQRHKDRLVLRRGYRLLEQACARCGAEIHTAADPGVELDVVCEQCYAGMCGG